jgi:hypothetical protein
MSARCLQVGPELNSSASTEVEDDFLCPSALVEVHAAGAARCEPSIGFRPRRSELKVLLAHHYSRWLRESVAAAMLKRYANRRNEELAMRAAQVSLELPHSDVSAVRKAIEAEVHRDLQTNLMEIAQRWRD